MSSPRPIMRWFLLASALLHVLFWIFLADSTPIKPSPPTPPKTLTIRLLQPPPRRKRIRPRIVRQRPVPRPRRRVVVRRRRPVRRKRRWRRRIVKRRRTRTKLVKRQAQRPTPRRSAAAKPAPRLAQRRAPAPRRSLRTIDLRPRLAIGPGGIASGKKPSRGKGRPQAWKGNSRFAKRMRAYHARWSDMMRERAGLTDMYFGKVATVIDQCIDIWTAENLAKRYKDRGGLTALNWTGIFHLTWDARGRTRLRLVRSRGYRRLDREVLKAARSCLHRAKLPNHLKGKRLTAVLRSRLKALRDFRPAIGIGEFRDPRTGRFRWGLTHPGKIYVNANTLLLRTRIHR